MRAVQGYTQWNIPHAGVLCTCCCPPRLSTPLLDRAQDTCSQPPGAAKQKVRKHPGDVTFVASHASACSHRCARNRAFPLSFEVVWLQYSKPSPPLFSCFMLIDCDLSPGGAGKYFTYFSSSLLLCCNSELWSLWAHGSKEPLPSDQGALVSSVFWIAEPLVVVMVSTLFCAEVVIATQRSTRHVWMIAPTAQR